MSFKFLPHISVAVLSAVGALALRDAFIKDRIEPGSQREGAPALHMAHIENESPTPFEIEHPGDLAASLKKRDDGHYWAEAKLNNRSYVDLMVDTGASICALTTEDARKLGIDWRTLRKDVRIQTAGGVVEGASVTIERMEIGRVLIRDVEAVVLDDHLDQSLLGMSFLERLSRWEVTRKAIIIRQ